MKYRILAATILIGFPVSASASTLPKHSLLCEVKSEMDEAVKAIASSDVEWLKSLHSCFMINQDLDVRILDYDGHTAKIRFFLAGQSAIGYTLDKSIKTGN